MKVYARILIAPREFGGLFALELCEDNTWQLAEIYQLGVTVTKRGMSPAEAEAILSSPAFQVGEVIY